ncbi:Activin_recp domain-containing protein [Caenorhabditis elegans]|uniref:Activin_recp domain-containing protein n=1 Tax=Caenorhabditis elegans TaxID=6239 RepID=U4PF43_CAEEL|nr:Activin_recp domain-containing protein [Caenorhabditis elegans]CDH93359.1 Activin_recp domain-containing protein [Caenorhabditis elegans]|eukprot:NP_001294772.1 Uncharacterized protein CELE_B0222.15 [Caenorhabditis elegans]
MSVHPVIICLFIFFFILPPSADTTVKCFKGFSGDGRPFKQRLCQTEYCIKTTEPTGGATYGCDDFTPFCKKDECVVTSKQSKVCCCNTDLCNSSPITFWPVSLLFFILFSYFMSSY